MSMPGTPIRMVNRLIDRLPANEYKLLVRSEKTVSLAHGGRRELYPARWPERFIARLLPDERDDFPDGTHGERQRSRSRDRWQRRHADRLTHVALGLDFSPTKAISQISGEGLRIPVAAFSRALKLGGTLDRLVRRYTAFSLLYGSQTIACNLLHSVEHRMCRWLLLCLDRVERDEFVLTHEFLAEMLGVRRQTVSVIAAKLQKASVIAYQRGIIRILNRKKLETASCECYGVIKASYDRIMQ